MSAIMILMHIQTNWYKPIKILNLIPIFLMFQIIQIAYLEFASLYCVGYGTNAY